MKDPSVVRDRVACGVYQRMTGLSEGRRLTILSRISTDFGKLCFEVSRCLLDNYKHTRLARISVPEVLQEFGALLTLLKRCGEVPDERFQRFGPHLKLQVISSWVRD